MNISGKYTIASATDYRDGIVLVAFMGNLYPHDLTPAQITHIKWFYNMPNSRHEIRTEWPDEIAPRYPAARTNFKNGFLLLTNNSCTQLMKWYEQLSEMFGIPIFFMDTLFNYYEEEPNACLLDPKPATLQPSKQPYPYR